MDMNTRIFWQEAIEQKYNRKHIDRKIRKEIDDSPEMQAKIEQGVELLKAWMSQDYFPSKNARLAQLKGMDLTQMVGDIFVGIAYYIQPVLYTSAVAQLAGRLGFDDKRAAIATMGEILAVLGHTDAYDITKESKLASLMVVSRIPLSEELVTFALNSEYLPPMIVKPKVLTNNYDSGYLTHRESLILGSGNHHEGDLCLDVLNTLNAVPLKLDTDFLSSEEELPTFDLDSKEKAEQWMRFKTQAHEFYKLMVRMGNRFYLTHKVDKRGRIYCSGYHISTQGAAYKKAMIELADEEVVEGVPDAYIK